MENDGRAEEANRKYHHLDVEPTEEYDRDEILRREGGRIVLLRMLEVAGVQWTGYGTELWIRNELRNLGYESGELR